MGVKTPWGTSQISRKITRGIIFYGTAGHGGFHVSPTLLRKMPSYMQNKDGWYEEDCEWAKVAICFPSFFTEGERKYAKKTLCNYFPAIYEEHYKVTLKPGESSARDTEVFLKEHENDYLVISAKCSDDYPGFIEGYATKGGVRENFLCLTTGKTFLIPEGEYKTRGHCFVIDPTKHTQIGYKLQP